MNVEKKTAAVVLAGGSGKRMNSDTKKQYIQIQDKPLLFYALNAFEHSCIEKIVLITSPGEEGYCQKQIVDKYQFSKVSAIVSGGKERYNSVFNGLKALENTDYVLIHDAARPFVTTKVIADALQGAKEYDACVIAVPAKDTIKIADEEGYVKLTPNRSTVWNVQTPQAFNYQLVYDAYSKIFKYEDELEITDDAMVVEHMADVKIKLIHGSYSNIKITTQEDLNGIENYMFEKYE